MIQCFVVTICVETKEHTPISPNNFNFPLEIPASRGSFSMKKKKKVVFIDFNGKVIYVTTTQDASKFSQIQNYQVNIETESV